MNRFSAFAIHLGISLVIFAILGFIIIEYWYPDFFFTADGGWQGIRIVALVDLVLGPTLTLVVYKKGKPSLKFDLTAIGVFQAVCLAAGVWVVFSERPLAMMYADGFFQTMTADDYLEAGKPVPDFADFPGRPPWISVQLPEDPTAQSKIRNESKMRGRSIKLAADFYVPFSPEHVDRQRDGITQGEIERIGAEVFEEFVKDHGGAVHDYLFLPFGTRYEQALMAFRKSDGELIYLQIPIPDDPPEEVLGSE